jgi:hypothetical protein
VDLRGVPPQVWLAVLGAACLLALVQSLRLVWRPWGIRRRLARSRQQGAAGELQAERLLQRLGYRILGRQVEVTYDLAIDGNPHAVGLRADFVVADHRGRYVAEVKTGEWAPRIETSATRRQLLEYQLAFRSLSLRGVLLVEPDADRVRLVEFPLSREEAPHGETGIAWLVAGIAAGTLVAIAARLFSNI